MKQSIEIFQEGPNVVLISDNLPPIVIQSAVFLFTSPEALTIECNESGRALIHLVSDPWDMEITGVKLSAK